MGARLGFAVITSLGFDCLMVDEVLAVGDVAFQRKCLRWFEDYRASGGTLLFVSHNMALVRSMTDRCIWLDHGTLMEEGPTARVLNAYARAMEHRDTGSEETQIGIQMGGKRNFKRGIRQRGQDRWGAGGVLVDEVHMGDAPVNGQAFDISIEYEVTDLAEGVFCLGFVDETGRELGAAASKPIPLTAGKGSITCTIEPLPLRSGVYFPFVAIMSPDGVVRDRWRLERALVVEHDEESLIEGFGPLDIPSAWSGS
jgi:hypothetical protein